MFRLDEVLSGKECFQRDQDEESHWPRRRRTETNLEGGGHTHDVELLLTHSFSWMEENRAPLPQNTFLLVGIWRNMMHAPSSRPPLCPFHVDRRHQFEPKLVGLSSELYSALNLDYNGATHLICPQRRRWSSRCPLRPPGCSTGTEDKVMGPNISQQTFREDLSQRASPFTDIQIQYTCISTSCSFILETNIAFFIIMITWGLKCNCEKLFGSLQTAVTQTNDHLIEDNVLP